jgi:hypothetical protein
MIGEKMRRIFKYPLNLRGSTQLPASAQILSIDIQHGDWQVWALVDPDDKATVFRNFLVYGTGNSVDTRLENLKHINTVLERGGTYIWHVFEDTTWKVSVDNKIGEE